MLGVAVSRHEFEMGFTVTKVMCGTGLIRTWRDGWRKWKCSRKAKSLDTTMICISFSLFWFAFSCFMMLMFCLKDCVSVSPLLSYA